jgi:hypothetical protein
VKTQKEKHMVKEVRAGVWESSLTGHEYSSLQAADFYDQREALRTQQASTGERILSALTAEEIRSLGLAMHREIDSNLSRPDGEAVANEWFKANPHVAFDTQEGYANAVAMRTYLKGQGRSFPYSAQDLDNAYEALAEMGEIKLVAKPPKKAVEDKWINPLDVQDIEARRLSKVIPGY